MILTAGKLRRLPAAEQFLVHLVVDAVARHAAERGPAPRQRAGGAALALARAGPRVHQLAAQAAAPQLDPGKCRLGTVGQIVPDCIELDKKIFLRLANRYGLSSLRAGFQDFFI